MTIRADHEFQFTSGVIRHTWTLSVEMQFYLIAPLIFYAIEKCRNRFVIPIAALLISLYLYRRFVETKMMDNTSSRLWQFMVGTIAYMMTEDCKECPSAADCRPLLADDIDSTEHEAVVAKRSVSAVKCPRILVVRKSQGMLKKR